MKSPRRGWLQRWIDFSDAVTRFVFRVRPAVRESPPKGRPKPDKRPATPAELEAWLKWQPRELESYALLYGDRTASLYRGEARRKFGERCPSCGGPKA